MNKKLDEIYTGYKDKIENVVMPQNAGGYNFVWGDGDSESEVVLVGEAPGKDEVKLGRPFVGKAGAILSEFLEKSGIERKQLFITNTIKYRLARRQKGAADDSKLSNRPARQEEIEEGAKLLKEEFAALKPKIVVTMGNVPLKALLLAYPNAKTGEKDKTIGLLHGEKIEISDSEGVSFVLFPIYHPASLIYNRALRGTYEEDLLKLKNIWFNLH